MAESPIRPDDLPVFSEAIGDGDILMIWNASTGRLEQIDATGIGSGGEPGPEGPPAPGITTADMAALALAPRCHWRLDDVAGATTAANAGSIGATITFAYSGATAGAASIVEGHKRSVFFDATGKTLTTIGMKHTAGVSPFTYGGATTFAAWFVADKPVIPGFTQTIAGNHRENDNTGVDIGIAPDGRLRASVGTGVATAVATGGPAIVAGRLYHVAVTIGAGGTVTLYVNGASVATVAGAAWSISFNDFALGHKQYSSGLTRFFGRMQLVSTWNVELSAGQIATLVATVRPATEDANDRITVYSQWLTPELFGARGDTTAASPTTGTDDLIPMKRWIEAGIRSRCPLRFTMGKVYRITDTLAIEDPAGQNNAGFVMHGDGFGYRLQTPWTDVLNMAPAIYWDAPDGTNKPIIKINGVVGYSIKGFAIISATGIKRAKQAIQVASIGGSGGVGCIRDMSIFNSVHGIYYGIGSDAGAGGDPTMGNCADQHIQNNVMKGIDYALSVTTQQGVNYKVDQLASDGVLFNFERGGNLSANMISTYDSLGPILKLGVQGFNNCRFSLRDLRIDGPATRTILFDGGTNTDNPAIVRFEQVNILSGNPVGASERMRLVGSNHVTVLGYEAITDIGASGGYFASITGQDSTHQAFLLVADSKLGATPSSMIAPGTVHGSVRFRNNTNQLTGAALADS